MSDNDFKFSWEIKYQCPKCGSAIRYKPERLPQEKGDFGVCIINWYECSKCEFRTKGVFDLIKAEE